MELPLTTDLRAELPGKYKQCKDLKMGNRLNMILLPDNGYTLLQTSKILRCDSDTVANWREKFPAADSIETFTTFPATVNAETTVELVEKILHQNPEKTRIYLIADNARYYRSKVVMEFLAENPQLVIKHLPTYSLNLNLIERLWKFMRKQKMNAIYYPTAKEFENAISSFFAQIHTMKAELGSFIGTNVPCPKLITENLSALCIFKKQSDIFVYCYLGYFPNHRGYLH